MSIFELPFFDPRHELKVHVVQLAIAIVIVVLTIVRLTQPVQFTRGQIMALSMGLKSITLIQYQLIVKHVPQLRKFGTPLRFMILNLVEVATWPVAIAFQFIGNSQICEGDSCKLQKAVLAMTFFILAVSIQPAISSTLDYVHRRRHNTKRGREPILVK